MEGAEWSAMQLENASNPQKIDVEDGYKTCPGLWNTEMARHMNFHEQD